MQRFRFSLEALLRKSSIEEKKALKELSDVSQKIYQVDLEKDRYEKERKKLF